MPPLPSITSAPKPLPAWALLALLAGLALPGGAGHAQTSAQTDAQPAAPQPAATTAANTTTVASTANPNNPLPGPVLRTGCPLIRPAGLSNEQVDAVVRAQVAMALQRPAAQLQLNLSLADQPGAPGEHPQGDMAQRFAYLALAIGEALGFDATERFSRAAQTQGNPDGVVGLPISTLQAVSRGAYQAGSDGSPPLADAASRYQLDGLAVGAPTMASGWYLLRCGHDQVAFWRQGVVEGETATAVARITSMPPWAGADAFVAYLRQLLLGTVPAGYTVRQVQVQALTDSAQPCAEAQLLARHVDAPYRMKARFCYVSTQAQQGHALLFSHAGSDDVPQFLREANEFIARASAR